MSIMRYDLAIDVTAAIPADQPLTDPIHVTTTVFANPLELPENPTVVLAIAGATYHRRYWDLQPPGREGYSQAAWLARRGVIFVACDYLGGGDSTRPDDGDFMTLEVAADAAHAVYEQVRKRLEEGELVDELPPLSGVTYIGLGQSLGGLITIVQQGKYGDYSGVGLLGASPEFAAEVELPPLANLPMYHGAPREQFLSLFHVPDVPEDLLAYDEAECHTVLSRVTGADALTPNLTTPFAHQIDVPVFLAFGTHDVSTHPRSEPASYPRSSDLTVVVMPDMAHMHNFADTRERLWRRFVDWLPTVTTV
ncbi:alpha/beta hydrolase [Streptomyces canus]|uniref:alpha/beta hydrolase n=1 Tax=Streptomyces canus TaxID=58343 RepID=UPI0033F1E5C8